MVAFDHLDTGTAESTWASDPHLGNLPGLSLDAFTHLVVLAAHPDDETLGCGGLIAEASSRGWDIDVLVGTLGEGSHPGSNTHSPAQLSQIRQREVSTAVAQLAPEARLHLPGLPDGGLAGHEPAVTALVSNLLQPDRRTLLVAPWRFDGHTDHDAAGRAAAVAAKMVKNITLLEYPIWLWHWAEPGDPVVPWPNMVRLGMGAEAGARKRSALAEHGTQVAPLSDEPGDEALLQPGMQAHFDRPFETFIHTPDQLGSRTVFERLYTRNPDPWGYLTRWFEKRKRAVTLASLPRERYDRVLEVGCSIGLLTEQLAARSGSLTAVDTSETALVHARKRLQPYPDVFLRQLHLPAEWPEEWSAASYDLIVVSEVGYFLTSVELDELLECAVQCLSDDGQLVFCHWRYPIVGWELDGAQVHERLSAIPNFDVLVHHAEEDFLLQILSRSPADSVARTEGLL